MSRIAFYPGTFDPVTNGHVDVLNAALALADTVIVAVGVNPGKSPMFSLEERRTMVSGMIRGLGRKAAARVRATTFDGLVVEAAVKAGASILVRGLRDASDFDYEMQMAGMNGALAPDLRTVFVPASPSVRHITATLVRQVAALGGDATFFVPKDVARMIARRFAR